MTDEANRHIDYYPGIKYFIWLSESDRERERKETDREDKTRA